MIITKIVYTKDNKSFTIFTSEDLEFTVHEDTFVKFNLYKSKEIDKNEIDDIIFENEKYNSINLSLKFLRNRKTEKEVRDYLKKSEIEKDIINYTIEYLKNLKYLNDYEYAVAFSNDKLKINKYGDLKIKNLLLFKGIDEDIVNEVISKLPQDMLYTNLRYACSKKIYSLRNSKNTYEKTVRHLIGKGYDYGQIKKIMRELL
ncbi:regulatory protein [Anaerosphaera aminiphila DSM 21120]|uniref:Regulatory protein RecX n=1 Tax=Anaerosphaera aminiphila DSM 21120 TaxID=1120995 RepID=A0A1M5P754_9FIRM|nr:RecX family transcriptional regulator [Anaerosphaera aminiphila]SHG97535.1 regulatory protein [Anaerosphaera aminiphila DSM 21120]